MNKDGSVKAMDQLIAEFCRDISTEPLSFFSEADLQSLLFSRLLAKFGGMVETSCARGPGARGCYKTSLLHREYGAGDSRRIDLVVFEKGDACKLRDFSMKDGSSYLRPDMGIELGTEKSPQTLSHILSDMEKLRQAKTRGYIIHFYRDTTRAPAGGRLRARAEERITSIYCSAIESVHDNKKVPDNVVVLAFLLRPRRDGRVWGKCSMFIPHREPAIRRRVADHPRWEFQNKNMIEETVLELCQREQCSSRV